jgi:hypothetical protein
MTNDGSRSGHDTGEERAEFMQRLRTLSEGLPTATQLDWDLSEAEDDVTPAPA